MKVELSEQVVQFIRQTRPEIRHRLRMALRHLEKGKGNIQPLEGELASYHRLRVGGIRIIFRHVTSETGPAIRCKFAERRSLIYEVYSAMARHLDS